MSEAGRPAVHVIPHTHWDREWYLPFAVYRRRLVGLVDTLLRALDDEPTLRFHLDGQMALVDDYLELRSERSDDLRSAAAAGRIGLGPWYTLPDEHLVSGEALIRNLEYGLERARRFAPGVEPLLVGYVPDQFGHTAQLPQIFQRFGIGTAVVWRGVPAQADSSVFRWAALDGSEVDAVHMREGYGHGRALPLVPSDLGARLEQELGRQRRSNPDGPWLIMSGDDHLPVPVGLAAAVAEAPLSAPPAISDLRAYASARPPARGRLTGELHSAATSFVLKGTLSARFPLKLQHARAERRLERLVEPLIALSGAEWPAQQLGYAWRQLILNSAHDSICGCSIDQVHEEGTRRVVRAERAAQAALDRLGPPTAWFNPVPRPRRGLPPLGVGDPVLPAIERVDPAGLGLRFEDIDDQGDEYTHEPAGPARLWAATALSAERAADEPFLRLRLSVQNQTADHRLRLLFPADTSEGAWAGTAFGAIQRRFREPGAEPGLEYDIRTDPARGWVLAGGTAVMMSGPFEYELLPGAIAVTLLRCVGWLSRADLSRRPGHAGPGISTPGAQMLGEHTFEIGLATGLDGWVAAAGAQELFALPPAPAPAVSLRAFPALADTEFLSALRRVGGRLQLRTWSATDFRIGERWLDG